MVKFRCSDEPRRDACEKLWTRPGRRWRNFKAQICEVVVGQNAPCSFSPSTGSNIWSGDAYWIHGPVPRPGDEYTVNATGYPDNSFDQVSGASYREIIDLSDWDHSVAVNVPGQSGQPGSPHYSDLLPLWSEGKYFPLLYSREAVEKEATDKLVLEP